MEKSEKVKFSHDDIITPSESQDLPSDYTDGEFKLLRRKVDRYLLPLMWLCHGLQSVDKACVGTQATFGLREDTGLVGQQYSWLTTVFYLTYMCFEFPSIVLLQRYSMGRVLSLYIIGWGLVVLCIGFSQNFTHLITLRALQGIFECCISPGFLLVVGTWYTTREHPSRALVFQTGYAGVSIITDSVIYGIGSVTDKNPDFQAWRYISFFLGGFTILAGLLCLLFLGTPSEVHWLSTDEKKIAIARVMANNTGHDRTGMKDWKWGQARECLVDPTFWFAGINAFVGAVPNGALSTFSAILNTTFGFTNLEVLLLNIPKCIFAVLYFLAVGVLVTKKKNLRMWVMMISTIPAIIGFILLAVLPNEPRYKWTKWGAVFMTCTFITATFFAWSLVTSNVAGRTKRTVVSTITFLGYCIGNMAGSQIFQAKDAPRYIPGSIGCAVCLGVQMLIIFQWRVILNMRNNRRDKQMNELGITEDDIVKNGREMGAQDCTDLENPYFRYVM
ncbi:MFS general substrate transporter [Hypoxylon trugodes]|uniref:MFS general substrate transporter n=1 Tax=Hypoxylon trugodes TaxID=326681 RepID=UPI00219E6186|nr:MFS general substrate transporter [Hypoxylon trugodes]KAI1384532.1 MFS general substrate transporter [Hypoxylon trugodes]